VGVDEYDNGLDATEGVEFYSGILCAGFVNAHSHIELAYLRGAIEEGGGYAAFASSIGKVRGEFSEEEQLSAIVEADRAMWAEGVDAVGDIVNGTTSFAVKESSKIYYHNFAEVLGLRECNLERQRELLRYPNTSLTPHSTYSVQDAPFKEVCGSAIDKPLSIHFLESESESKLYNGEGSLHEWYKAVGFECDFLHYGSPTQRIVESVPGQRSVMLVHNCALAQCDIDTMVSHFTAPLYWVLCPRSNRYISGIEPQSVALLRASKLNICIGTDSLSSNWSLSMVEELKQFSGVPLAEKLLWATINGAKALGIDDRFGTIEVGKQSGIVNLIGVNLDDFTLTEASRAVRIL
jgi:cytosine/adenosine deaminase-related metal-dependent hydrolase